MGIIDIAFVAMSTIVCLGGLRVLYQEVEDAYRSREFTGLYIFLGFTVAGIILFLLVGHFGGSDNLKFGLLFGLPALPFLMAGHHMVYVENDGDYSDLAAFASVIFAFAYGIITCAEFG